MYNDDFVYADPPYLQATASYNNNWTKEDTQSLFTKLLDHHNNGGSFALSEFIIHNEQRNTLLDQFIQTGRFNMHFINSDYSSCNCGRKKGYSLEVLVTNY
ncbi:DNA adenine methylase [Mucispirillum schaedleri]|uniref:DNA adenine methylase n=1 Tax=Mucispirillum schaedleri TaxID=248039 RepID=UPI003D314824